MRQPICGLGRPDLTNAFEIRGSAGQVVSIASTHRFRHMRATSLLNAGVPIHVIMKYLGHKVTRNDHALRQDQRRGC